MSDVTERVRELDRIRAPELWPDIQGRDPGQGEPEPLKRGLAIVLAFAVAAAGVGLAARALLSSNRISVPVVPINPKVNGKIAFACGDPTYLGGANLCVIEPDGMGLVRLAEGFQVTAPSWSPDGTRILFQQGGGIDSGGASIFIMNADGSGGSTLIQRDEIPAYDRFPDWSPDGQRLAFSRSVYDDGSYVGEYTWPGPMGRK